MALKLNWRSDSKTYNSFSFMIVGPAPNCLRITEQVKILLDDRFKNKHSLVHCCEDLNQIVEEVNVFVDFVVILVDCTHHRTSELKVKHDLHNIDPRYFTNSRVIFVKLINYSLNIDRDMLSFVTQLSKTYDCICLTGNSEEPKLINEISQSIVQYAFYLFQKKFVSSYYTFEV